MRLPALRLGALAAIRRHRASPHGRSRAVRPHTDQGASPADRVDRASAHPKSRSFDQPRLKLLSHCLTPNIDARTARPETEHCLHLAPISPYAGHA